MKVMNMIDFKLLLDDQMKFRKGTNAAVWPCSKCTETALLKATGGSRATLVAEKEVDCTVDVC